MLLECHVVYLKLNCNNQNCDKILSMLINFYLIQKHEFPATNMIQVLNNRCFLLHRLFFYLNTLYLNILWNIFLSFIFDLFFLLTVTLQLMSICRRLVGGLRRYCFMQVMDRLGFDVPMLEMPSFSDWTQQYSTTVLGKI